MDEKVLAYHLTQTLRYGPPGAALSVVNFACPLGCRSTRLFTTLTDWKEHHLFTVDHHARALKLQKEMRESFHSYDRQGAVVQMGQLYNRYLLAVFEEVRSSTLY